MNVTYVSGLVDQIVCRPVVVRVRLPGPVTVVEGDWIADGETFDGCTDVAKIVLECELGRVDAQDDEALRAVARIPRLQVRKRAQAVDAGVRPEVDEHHFAPELGDAERA